MNKSQGRTLSRIGLDLRNDIFAHGQLYVALSRIKNRHSIMCLVPPSHIADGVAHARNVVYSPFIEAATGNAFQPPPVVLPPPLPPAAGNNWTLVDEIGDGACLFRFISRRVLGDPEHHPSVRASILQYIQQDLHEPLFNTGLSSYNVISFGKGLEALMPHQDCIPHLRDTFSLWPTLAPTPAISRSLMRRSSTTLTFRLPFTQSTTYSTLRLQLTTFPISCTYLPSSSHYVSLRYNALS